jgi:hypothetical protein
MQLMSQRAVSQLKPATWQIKRQWDPCCAKAWSNLCPHLYVLRLMLIYLVRSAVLERALSLVAETHSYPLLNVAGRALNETLLCDELFCSDLVAGMKESSPRNSILSTLIS